MTDTAPALVEVHLLRLPVPAWAKAQEHMDELMREFQLIVSQPAAERRHEVPRRLLELVEQLGREFQGVSTEQEQQLADAAAAGTGEIDLTFRVPAAAAAASRVLGERLDEADAYCREGAHLLTLETPPEALRFRRWYLGEFIHQIEDGAQPVPWPEYAD